MVVPMLGTIKNGASIMAQSKIKTTWKITAKKMGLSIYKKK